MTKTRVILDTNVLLLFGQEHIDVFSEIDRALTEPYFFLLLEPCLEELKRLAQKTTKDGKAAKLGLSLVQEKLRRSSEPFLNRLLLPSKEIPLKTLPCSEEHADDAIVRIAEDDARHTVVATLDKGLQRRLLKSQVRVLSIKQKQFSIIE